jgi:hypothetical protein
MIPGMYWFLRWQRWRNRLQGAVVNPLINDVRTGLVLVICWIVWKAVELMNIAQTQGSKPTAPNESELSPLPTWLTMFLVLISVVRIIEASLYLRYRFACNTATR